MKATKVILPIALVLIALIAIFFLAPLKAWKEGKEYYTQTNNDFAIYSKKEGGFIGFCGQYWKEKLSGTIDGGMLPEITVTANK